MGLKEAMRDRVETTKRVLRKEVLSEEQSAMYPVYPVAYENGYRAHVARDVNNLVRAVVMGSNTEYHIGPEWPEFRGTSLYDTKFHKLSRRLPEMKK